MSDTQKQIYQTTEGTFGEIKIANDVLASIAAIAATGVEGVKETVGSNTTDLVNKLMKKNTSKGVRVLLNNGEIVVDISLVLKYGYEIKDTSNKVQEEIKKALESMTDFTVTDINVNIANIDIDA